MKTKSPTEQPDKPDNEIGGTPPWSEAVFRELADNIIDGVYCLNTDGYFTFVNRAITERSGISPDKFYASHFLDIVHPAYRDLTAQNFQRVMRGESSLPFELRYEGADGQERIVEVNSKLLHRAGKVVGLLGISRDVTKRKQAEKAFQESEKRFRLAAEYSADFIWEWDIRTGDLAWFGPIDKELGYEAGEFPRTIGAWESIIHPDDHTRVMAALDRHLKDRTPYDKEYRVLKKDGGMIYWADRGCAVWNQEDEPCKMVGAVTDITDHKLFEEMIKASERQFRTLIESIPIGIVTYEGTKYRYVNPAFEKITGYTREELYLMDVWEIVHPEFKDNVMEYVHKQQKGEPSPKLYVVKIVTKSGEGRWVERGAIPIELNEKPSVLITTRDITEHKQAEEAVRKSEEKYRALLENASDANLLADEKGNLIEANRKAEELFGYPREELLQMHYTQLHPMMELEKTIAAFKDIVAHGKGGLQNGAIRRKDGTVVPIDITSTVIEYNGRKVIQASFRDITEHKRMEDTLERLVRERTAELFEKNIQLVEEVMERKRAETALRKKTNELQLHSGKLEELNAALKVLLQQREQDRTELEEKVISNVKYLLSPHLEKLKKRKFDRKSKMHLDILESNLHNIVSSFSNKLSSKHINLTPTEIKVANLVREGKTTKEIAEFLGSSPSSIKIHRFHIRRKLGLIGKETNLQSYLTSLS